MVQGTAAVGSQGVHQQFTIACGAHNADSGVGAVVKEQVQAFSVHLNRYGVFYEDDLEIDPGPQMYFHGPVHANGDLYVDGPIDFHDRLTAHGNTFHKRKDDGTVDGNVYIENEIGTMLSMMDGTTPIDSTDGEWMTRSLTRWNGRVLDSSHAVPYLSPPYNPLDSPHDIIERALPTNHPSYHADTEAAKFANRAALYIHVDASGTFTATDFFGSDLTAQFTQADLQSDTATYGGVPLDEREEDGEYTFDTSGSYQTANTFTDAREGATMAPVDLYIAELLAEFPALVSGSTYGVSEGRGIIYVTRDDPDGAGGVVPAVRLRNGEELPAFGLTVGSDLPLYVDGDYNTDGGVKPALVAGDAVTLLSSDWQDVRSTGPLTDRVPVDTTYNAVVMTGNYSTTPGGNYNGGLENVLRFLEQWTGHTVTYRGSIIDLWFSEIAQGLWGSSYYSPPYRDWGYDSLYRSSSPPGVLMVFAVEQIHWVESTWAAEGW